MRLLTLKASSFARSEYTASTAFLKSALHTTLVKMARLGDMAQWRETALCPLTQCYQ